MHGENPFHLGEIAIQALAGERATALRNGRIIADGIPEAAQLFLAAVRTCAVATIDDGGAVWASWWTGAPGFVSPTSGEASVREPIRPRGDPVWAARRVGRPFALLAIEPATRRRFRVNGTVTEVGADGLRVAVREAFPNCPRWIRRRRGTPGVPADPADPRGPAETARIDTLDAAGGLIARCDTLFVASAHPERGADVSHRGGPPGFVRRVDARTLRIPDYAGNGMFQTLGNLAVDPRAGVILLDPAGGAFLAITGEARLLFDAEDPAAPTGGTGRYWELTAHRLVAGRLPGPRMLDLEPPHPAPPA